MTDLYTHTERDAARWEAAHADEPDYDQPTASEAAEDMRDCE